MLSPKVSKLVQEVFARQSEDAQRWVKEDPEKYLVSLLETIKERLPIVSATLKITVEQASGKLAEANWKKEFSRSS